VRYCTLYLVIHSSASQRPCVRIPEITFTSFRSICSHCPLSWYLESHAHLGGHHQPRYIPRPCPCRLTLLPRCCRGALVPHSRLPAEPLGKAFPDSPEALAVEAGLVGRPGGVPARVLIRVGATYLVGGDSAGLEAQGLVVGALCRTKEKHPTIRPRAALVPGCVCTCVVETLCGSTAPCHPQPGSWG